MKKIELFEIWLKQPSKNSKNDILVQYVLNKVDASEIDDDCEKLLVEKVRLFCKYLERKWIKSGRRENQFRNENFSWLNSEISFQIKKAAIKSTSSTVGRPEVPFCKKSEYGKRRAAAELSTAILGQTDLLVQAAATSARKEGNANLAAVLKETIASPTRPSKIKKMYSESQPKPNPLSADEALAFFIENSFTTSQYNAIRRESKSRNCDIYPHYNQILAAKSKCRPEGIKVTETVARAPLESVVLHTANRIVEMQKEVFEAVMESENSDHLKCELIFSYGFDSSTGQAQYKQIFHTTDSSNNSDASLLATTIIPLRLVLSSGTPIWNNNTPQSTRFCRPIKLEFVKETKESILREELDLRKEIDALQNLLIHIGNGKTVQISFKLYLTLIDGKVLNILTGTKSTQACPICGATPTDFLNITDYSCERFRAKESNIKFGLSPLHSWIRFFEFILHLGYKCKVEKWQIRSEDDKLKVSKRKEEIQNAFWRELGLRVDMPKVGGFGSTNDGNTARRAFSSDVIFADITGVNHNLIFRLKVILICLSCNFPINPNKFETYCFQTAKMIQDLYRWLPMTSTVHKVLIHSKQVIENTILPIGVFGESAAESRHKIYKSDRLHHARKNSRTNNLLDVFNRALDTSDPIISTKYLSRRMQQHKPLNLPHEVIELLSSNDIIENVDEENHYEQGEFLSGSSINILSQMCLENELQLTDTINFTEN